ncbi:ROK family protein [Candidatus Mycoplasma mahonii]|uniref:ROK family protein n=1 Tax=Candidatus Mycoplasma mahonii TaxID=3004105 RepID=UPI0026F20924|nr:ROK family protein [Candidatus Mycoplasma mahonii]WKX02633.1 ROK family protein [Candidatus Mycoplasma mahonii]
MKKIIAFDIGGNGVQFKCGNYEGSFSTINKDKDFILKKMSSLIKRQKATHVGISSPCVVNSKTGYLKGLSGIKNWGDFNLYDSLRSLSGDVVIKAVNDANAALLGVLSLDENKKYKNALMITIGTGIGGGVFINGDIYNGTNGFAGEFGYGLTQNNAERKNVSLISSANALMSRINSKNHAIIAKSAKSALNSNNELIKKEVEKWFEDIAKLTITKWYDFDPEVIFLAGGVSNHKDLEPILKKFIKNICSDYGYEYIPHIKISKIKNTGILGAETLFKNL